ncbi:MULTISPECIES: acetyl-CoA C-acyltransferase [unclassified Leptolyngbya]|uniref:thiolase family protein n=1 Tax=unclassified Leptolyngbya TaxID=2650499 RepID=UPI0016821A6E|nr:MULTISPECIES: acetyl-CoA C-acyltransferase [unclassified Leptolyngbya]MBD1910489.1 acetyl-CoA C-acyltransferase [Leptolyngbya sp. FACHB-8]MBD2153656.1 acetyl-CoA C-acyltransferase [Leptolyngbya sp. FACHB-16]
MNNTYIVSSVRTAVGKAPRGTLRHTRPDDLGATAVKGAIAQIPNLVSNQIDDVILGCAMPEAEQGFNLGRIVAMRAGLPDSVSGCTVNRLCSSGLQSIAMATQAIAFGQADVIVAGGVESMSLIPMGGHQFLPNADLLADAPGAYITMGLTAENVAERFHVSRADQDAYALRSHQRALKAIAAGHFKDEIIPLTVRETLYENGQPVTHEIIFDTDEGPRADTSLEALANLKPAFRLNGTVTAGNASQMSDGAAATVVMSERMVNELGVKPLGRLLGYAVAGVAPEIMGIGPAVAIPKVLQQVGLTLGDIGLIELNEAFAAQALAVIRELGLNDEIVSVNGGAIALGHPLGCSGAKLTATLLHEMKRRGVRYGLVSMCVGGGMGAAGVFELML